MPHPIEAMKRERQRHHHLRENLQRHRPLRKARRHCRACHAQPKQGRGPPGDAGKKVEDAETVEADGEDGPGDAVEGGVYPGYLGSVDGKVGSDGSVEALIDENLRGGGFAGCGGVVGDAGGCASAGCCGQLCGAAGVDCRLCSTHGRRGVGGNIPSLR